MNGGSCAGRLVAQTLSHVLGGSTADLLRAAAASGAAAEGPAVASTPTDLPVVGRLAGQASCLPFVAVVHFEIWN